MQLIHHHGVNSGKLSLNRFVEITSTAPARIFGMYPKKGTIAAGSDADLVLWDPNAEHTISAATHNMRCDYSMFEGFKVRGNAKQVYSRGELIVENGKYLGKVGRGAVSAPRCAWRGLAMITPESSLYNADLAPTPAIASHLDHLQLHLAVVLHVDGSDHVHARLRPHRRRHELEAGDLHHCPRQPHRAHSDAAQRACRREVRHSVSRLRARILW